MFVEEPEFDGLLAAGEALHDVGRPLGENEGLTSDLRLDLEAVRREGRVHRIEVEEQLLGFLTSIAPLGAAVEQVRVLIEAFLRALRVLLFSDVDPGEHEAVLDALVVAPREEREDDMGPGLEVLLDDRFVVGRIGPVPTMKWMCCPSSALARNGDETVCAPSSKSVTSNSNRTFLPLTSASRPGAFRTSLAVSNVGLPASLEIVIPPFSATTSPTDSSALFGPDALGAGAGSSSVFGAEDWAHPIRTSPETTMRSRVLRCSMVERYHAEGLGASSGRQRRSPSLVRPRLGSAMETEATALTMAPADEGARPTRARGR